MSRPKPRIRQNIYGNWYGYVGTSKVRFFYGWPEQQEQEAREWLNKQLAASKKQ